MSARRILIVEDEKPIRDMIAFGLRRAGYDVREAEDCREARARIVDVRPDLMLVDWMLPDMSGLELTRSLKRAKDTEEIPVIMLTARAEEQDKVNGLEGGADDYITKPFSPRELLARIQAVLRRRRIGTMVSDEEPMLAGQLTIRPDRFDAYVGDEPAGLSRKEYELLRQLASAGGRVLEREQIYQRVWGYTMVRGDRSVDVFVRKLRTKLEKLSPEWRYVHTHFGIGYRFAPQRVDGGSGPAAPPPTGTPASGAENSAVRLDLAATS